MLIMYLDILDINEEKTKFEILYDLYKNTMRYLAFNILKDNNLAEDAVSEAFLRISKNFNKIGDVDSIQTKSFVCIIVKNIAITMLKSQNKTIIFNEYNDINYIIDESINIEKDILESIAIDEIVEQVLNLPDTYRDILYIHFISELTISETAVSLGISKETAKKRIQRGKVLLITKLEREGDF